MQYLKQVQVDPALILILRSSSDECVLQDGLSLLCATKGCAVV